MPDLNDQHKEYINRDASFFTGEPQRKLKQPSEDEDQNEAQNEPSEKGSQEENENNSEVSEEEEVKVPPKELVEIDRVKYVVYSIENDCQIAPLGAFKMTSQHQVRRNEAFRGLEQNNCLSLSSYVHFRNVQSEYNKAALDLPSAPFNKNFLESISGDKPKGCWNFLNTQPSQNVLGRSLLWPGYHFYHHLGSNKFGSIYIGDGLKNLEL